MFRARLAVWLHTHTQTHTHTHAHTHTHTHTHRRDWRDPDYIRLRLDEEEQGVVFGKLFVIVNTDTNANTNVDASCGEQRASFIAS